MSAGETERKSFEDKAPEPLCKYSQAQPVVHGGPGFHRSVVDLTLPRRSDGATSPSTVGRDGLTCDSVSYPPGES